MQTIRGWRRRGGRALVRHGSNGGEEVGVGEVRIRRWRWSAWIPATLEPPPALTSGRSSEGERCGGRLLISLALLLIGGESRDLCPGPPPILYSAGDGGPPTIWAGAPDQGVSRSPARYLDWAWRSTPT